MRNYKKYRSTVINLFQSFLAEKINKKEFVSELYKIEMELGGNEIDNDLWFRFSDDDTLITTVCNLDIDLEGSKNEKYVREQMQIAINNPKELKIYYS